MKRGENMGLYADAIRDRISGKVKLYAISVNGGGGFSEQFQTVDDLLQLKKLADICGWNLVIIPHEHYDYVSNCDVHIRLFCDDNGQWFDKNGKSYTPVWDEEAEATTSFCDGKYNYPIVQRQRNEFMIVKLEIS